MTLLSTVYLVSLRLYENTYYRAVMAENMLDTPEMRRLRESAISKGFRLDLERLDTIESMERFLEHLP